MWVRLLPDAPLKCGIGDKGRKMTPTKIFKKAESAWKIAKIGAFLFWLPIIAVFISSFFWN
jgi:hypothetical protein